MALDSLFRKFAGLWSHKEAAKTDVKQLFKKQIVVSLPPLGAAAASVPLHRFEADVTLLSVKLMSGETIAAGANNPDFGLEKNAGGGGSDTALSATNAYDGPTDALTANTEHTMTLTETSISAGDYVKLLVGTNGTPADIVGASAIIEWEYTN